MAATGICSGKTGILPEIDDRVLAMADPISPSPVAPEAGMVPNTPGPDRADLRPENIQDAVIRLAGNSQDGIQTAGAFLARLAGRSDQDVMTYMTIPATISGGPSIFQVRIGSGEVLSAGDEADFLVASYQHSYQDHIGFVREGGVVLYDSDNVEPNFDDKRFVYVGVPITGLTVEALGGTAKDKGKNIFVLGLITKIFSLDVEKLKKIITEKFAGKDDSIVNTALMAEIPLLICNIQRGGPSTGLPTNVEQSDLHQAIYGGHGDSPRVVLAAKTVEDCFYIAIEAARIARKYSTPVFILSDTSLATRIEAFDEPDLSKLMVDPKPDLSPRQTFKPYPVDAITQHIPPGTRILDGKYPLLSGLEHDEMGHPTGSPKLHMVMTAKRRNKLRKLAEEIPLPEIYGDKEGDVLLIGWGSTYGPIHDAVKQARDHGEKVGAIHLRHIHPLPNGIENIFAKFKRIVVVEMNDQGVYGFGQLAIILRARYCEPKIESFTKTDGLTFRVKEILDGVFKGRSFAARKIPRDGAAIIHSDTAPESVKSVREVVPQGVG